MRGQEVAPDFWELRTYQRRSEKIHFEGTMERG